MKNWQALAMKKQARLTLYTEYEYELEDEDEDETIAAQENKPAITMK